MFKIKISRILKCKATKIRKWSKNLKFIKVKDKKLTYKRNK